MSKNKFKPPYWYHDNIIFSKNKIKKLKSDLKTIASKGFEKDDNHISTYFIDASIRPDGDFNLIYNSIVEDIMKSVGIFYKTKYTYEYWSQYYNKGMSHRAHHHANTDQSQDAEISWVHFLDVPEQKCFRFTDTRGNFLIPEEQLNGDIICFPSFVWHQVVTNESDTDRLVIAGNISVTHYDD